MNFEIANYYKSGTLKQNNRSKDIFNDMETCDTLRVPRAIKHKKSYLYLFYYIAYHLHNILSHETCKKIHKTFLTLLRNKLAY